MLATEKGTSRFDPTVTLVTHCFKPSLDFASSPIISIKAWATSIHACHSSRVVSGKFS
jgi:hypothetical protein